MENKNVNKAIRKATRVAKKAVRAGKSLAKAVSAEAKSVQFKVNKLSTDAGKAVEKVQKNSSHMLIAAVVAGFTLVASAIGYVVYLVTRGGKKANFKTIKVNVLREVRNATQEAKEAAVKHAENVRKMVQK